MLQTQSIYHEKNINNQHIFLNLIYAFFPISFVTGSFFVNINLLLFCCLGLFYLKHKIFTHKYNFPTKIILLFFVIIIFSTALSFAKNLYFEGFNQIHFDRLIKSIFFFRFFLFLIIVQLLIKFNFLNFKYFILVATISPLVVSLDIIFQYFYGSNILGLKSFGFHNSGFFGDEVVAGGYIQRFAFFSMFFILIAFKDKNRIKFISFVTVLSILSLGIFLAGNRMPLLLFIFGLALIFFTQTKIKKIIFSSLLIVTTLMIIIISPNEEYKEHLKNSYSSFYSNALNVITPFSKCIINRDTYKLDCTGSMNIRITRNDIITKGYEEGESRKSTTRFYTVPYQTHYKRIFLSAIEVWKPNKIFGNGIKSFRLDCPKLKNRPDINLNEWLKPNKKNRLCSTHPHNYYFEVLVETGIAGLVIAFMIAIMFIIFIFKNYKLTNKLNEKNLIIIAASVSLILELLPLKNTGSLFTTNNATYIILISSIILSYQTLNKINDN